MKFKKWLEDTTVAGSEYGNRQDPMDAGLYDAEGQGTYKPVPESEKAKKLFLGKKRKRYAKDR